jgi:hypothetical protein
MKEIDANAEYIEYLVQTRLRSRIELSGFSSGDQFVVLSRMQEQIYSVLEHREQLFGVPIPEIWRKWRAAKDVNAT